MYFFLLTYRRNWQLLRDATNEVGALVEQWSYEQLDHDAEELPPVRRTIKGHDVVWQVDRYRTGANGELCICVDCWSGLQTLFGVKPSYVFIKQPDGMVRPPD